MPRELPFDVAFKTLRELLESMAPGEELVLTENGVPKAVMTKAPKTSWPCEPGSANDFELWMAADIDTPLDDFAEYFE